MGGNRVVSRRTWGLALFGVIVSLGGLVLARTGVGGSESVAALVANLPSLITAGVATSVALWAALRFERGEGLQRQWFLVGLGALALFAGDAIYAYLEIVARQEVPFPSAADAFYLASFPLMGAALLMALLGFRKSLNLKSALLVAAAVAALATIALWASVFSPILSDMEVSVLERVLGVFYPVGDFWLLVFPALALSIALSRFGGGRIVWPWWAVVAGFALIAAADTGFSLTQASDTYFSGSPIDLGWTLGYTAIAIGASLVIDVQKPRKRGDRS